MKYPPPYPDPFPNNHDGIPVLRWIILGVGTIAAVYFSASSIAYFFIGVVAKVRGWM